VWVTGEALMALDGKALPLGPVARATPASTHHPAVAATAAARHPAARVSVPHRTRRARRAAAALPSAAESPAPVVNRLAGYAGILTAITLAPLGQG
jgi:hypothetical protein